MSYHHVEGVGMRPGRRMSRDKRPRGTVVERERPSVEVENRAAPLLEERRHSNSPRGLAEGEGRGGRAPEILMPPDQVHAPHTH